MVNVLYFPKELYPFDRVRLTQLYQKDFTLFDNKIHWIVQPFNQKIIKKIESPENNYIYFSKTKGHKNNLQKIASKLLILMKYHLGEDVIKSNNIDIILVCDGIIEGFVGYLLSKKYHKPFIFYLSHLFFHIDINELHNKKSLRNLFKFLIGIIKKNLYFCLISKSVIFHTISEEMKNYFTNFFPDKNIIPLPLCPNKFFINSYIEKKINYSNKKTIIYVGKVNELRKIDEILFILSDIKKSLKKFDLKLEIIGPSSKKYLEKLKKIASNLEIKRNVEFKGKKPINQIPNIIQKADVGISIYPPYPVFQMCSPTKAVEYLSLGTPVVGNKEVEDMKDVIERSKGGFLVNYNRDEYVRYICYLLENPEIAKNMGENGRIWILKNRNYKLFAGIIDKEYRKLMKSYRGI